jgi:hypothetical protein
MSKNITWIDRTDSETATGETTEWSKDQANPLKAWAVAPLQPLGAFDGDTILIDGTGSYDNFTMSANLIITFAESEHQEGNGHIVKITADGTKTLTFTKPSAYILIIPNSLTNGAILASGIYTFAFIFKNGEIEVNMLTKQAIAAVIPTVSSMSVEAAEPNQFIANFSEACTGSELGWDFEVDDVNRSITYLSGSGTIQIKYTISGAAITSVQSLDAAYDSGTGDTLAVAVPNNPLATFVATSDNVTNNIGWTPADLGANLMVWLEAATIGSDGSVVDGGNLVGTWKNKGVNGDFTETTNKPLWDGSTKVTFDGVNDIMSIVGSKSQQWVKDIHNGNIADIAVKFNRNGADFDDLGTIIGTSKLNGDIGFICYYEDRSAFSNNDNLRTYVCNGTGTFSVNNKSANDFFPAQTTAWARFHFDADNGTAADRSTIYNESTTAKNNAQTSAPSTSDATYDIQIGGLLSDGDYLTCEIVEIIVCDRAFTSQEWIDIKAR